MPIMTEIFANAELGPVSYDPVVGGAYLQSFADHFGLFVVQVFHFKNDHP